MRDLLLEYTKGHPKGFVSQLAMIMFQVILMMIVSMVSMINNYRELILKQRELINHQQEFNDQCLGMFNQREILDICHNFNETDILYVGNERYIYYYNSNNELISVKNP